MNNQKSQKYGGFDPHIEEKEQSMNKQNGKVAENKGKNPCTVMKFGYTTSMTVRNPITADLAPMNENDLRDMLDDGPRAGNFNPTPDEVQEVLAQIHADMGDRDPNWSSDEDGLSPADAQALQNHLDG